MYAISMQATNDTYEYTIYKLDGESVELTVTVGLEWLRDVYPGSALSPAGMMLCAYQHAETIVENLTT